MKIPRKTIVGLSVVGIIIGGAAFFNHWSNNPASTTLSSTSNGEVLSSQITLKEFKTDYFSTMLPDTLQIKTRNENPRGAIIGSYLFKSTDVSVSDQLAITVGHLNENAVDSISGAKLRSTKPDEYTKTAINNMPNGAIGYQKINGYEKAVFWAQNGNYYSVVMSGSVVRQAQLDEVLQAVLTNWQ